MLWIALAEAAPEPNPAPETLLGDWPAYVEPIEVDDLPRYEEAPLVDDAAADLLVRAWRFEPTLGIVESDNELRSDTTALVMVHPWGIEDGQGWAWPQAYEAYGYVFEGLYDDNQLYLSQVADVVHPLLESLRGRLPLIVYSLPGSPDDIRTSRYRSWATTPGQTERAEAQVALEAYLAGLQGAEWPTRIPVVLGLDPAPDDVVAYDDEGWSTLRAELEAAGITHVLLAGWAADMCVISTSAGYADLAAAFDVFLVGDATMAAWPLTEAPPNGYVPVPTQDALLTAAQVTGLRITQASAIELLDRDPAGGPSWRGEEGSWTALFDTWQARSAEADREVRRAPDWASAGAPAVRVGSIDAEAVRLDGVWADRTNVLVLPEGTPLTIEAGEPADVWITADWAPDREGQRLTLDPGLTLQSESEEGGWRRSTWSGPVEGTLTLAFDGGEGVVDRVVVDAHAPEEPADSGPGDSGTADSGERETEGTDTDTGDTDVGTDRPVEAGGDDPGCGCGGGSPVSAVGVGLAAGVLLRRPRRGERA